MTPQQASAETLRRFIEEEEKAFESFKEKRQTDPKLNDLLKKLEEIHRRYSSELQSHWDELSSQDAITAQINEMFR